MVESDSTADQVAIALKNLFPTILADETSQDSERILRQVIVRFVRNEKYRALVEGMEGWKSRILAQLLELSEVFFLECDEDNDYGKIWDAAQAASGNLHKFKEHLLDESFETNCVGSRRVKVGVKRRHRSRRTLWPFDSSRSSSTFTLTLEWCGFR